MGVALAATLGHLKPTSPRPTGNRRSPWLVHRAGDKCFDEYRAEPAVRLRALVTDARRDLPVRADFFDGKHYVLKGRRG